MANKISQVIEVDTKSGIKNVDGLAKALQDAEADGKSAGKVIAAAMDQMASDIEADFLDSRAAADALGAALGPELAAKIGQGGLDKLVADLKTTGLTSDQIVTDVDELAAAIKHLDDVGKQLDGPKQGLRDVGDAADMTKGQLGGMRGEADNSRSVMANMVGNSAQDVAGLGGVAGTAGMALGQLGEYAAEGNISLQGLAKVAGPMALVTVAAMGIAQTMGEIAATKAFNKKQVQDWAKAIREGKSDIEDLALAAEEAGKIDFRMLGDTRDLVPILAEAGIKAETFFAAVKGSKSDMQAFIQNAKDAGVANEDLSALIIAGVTAQENYRTALQNAGDQHVVFGDSATTAKTQQENLQTAVENVADAAGKKLVDAEDEATAAFERNEAASESLRRQVQADIDAMIGKIDELKGNIDDDQAWLDLQSDFDDVKTKAIEAWDAAAEGAEDAEQKTRDAQTAVNDNKKAVIDYATEVLNLPESRITQIVAALDAGQLDLIEQQLLILTRNRQINIDLVGRGAASYGGRTGDPEAAEGGIVMPRHGGTRVIVGEAGSPEAIIPLDGKHGLSSGGDTYITIKVEAGVDGYLAGKRIAGQLAAYTRRSGEG